MDTDKNFLSSTISGKHMLCDFRGVRNIDLMNSVEDIQALLDIICETYSFQVLARNGHAFHPIGVTVLYMLSESHISVHTFPERFYVAVDIYTCREMHDNSIYDEIYSSFFKAFDVDSEMSGKPLILDRSFL